MSLWTNKDHRTILNDSEDLAFPPSYSPWTKWFMGCLVPLAVCAYAVVSIFSGSITFLGSRNSMDISGRDVPWLAAAYMALGAFLHFHCFWNLQERLQPFAQPLKVLSLLVFLPCLLIVLYHQLGF